VSVLVQVIELPDVIVIGFGTYELVPSVRAPTGIDTAAATVATGAGDGDDVLLPHAEITQTKHNPIDPIAT